MGVADAFDFCESSCETFGVDFGDAGSAFPADWDFSLMNLDNVEFRSILRPDFSESSSALSCAITFQRAMSGCSSSRSMAPLLFASHSSST